jgi:hypothetical protein
VEIPGMGAFLGFLAGKCQVQRIGDFRQSVPAIADFYIPGMEGIRSLPVPLIFHSQRHQLEFST